ncbi:MAG: hypothetical protein GY749_21860 [Desulfobacteraceae bacterium]|nr:hypothetical protein [Desulfobacteraceae bacterium]
MTERHNRSMKEEFKACFVSVAYKASFELLFHIKIREWILSDFNQESRHLDNFNIFESTLWECTRQ